MNDKKANQNLIHMQTLECVDMDTDIVLGMNWPLQLHHHDAFHMETNPTEHLLLFNSLSFFRLKLHNIQDI